MEGFLLHRFPNNDTLRQYGKGLIIDFQGKRKVLSTSMLNGGFTDYLTRVFNYNCLADNYDCSMCYDTYEQELESNACSLNLDPKFTSGLSTAALVECAAICTKEYKDQSVTAIVTAGIDHNAIRIGDPASYYEESNVYTPLSPGTINILLYINHDMPAGTMTRAMTMCTEAKVAAIQELMIGSCYSQGIATGSGTDGTIIICDATTQSFLTDAGGHSKLGELIGLSVKSAVKDALLRQTSASPARQHSILERGKRFGIGIGSMWTIYNKYLNQPDYIDLLKPLTLEQFESKITNWQTNSNLVVYSSLFYHLMDQMNWKLLEWPELIREFRSLCTWFLTVNYKGSIKMPTINYETTEQNSELLEYYQLSIILRIFA